MYDKKKDYAKLMEEAASRGDLRAAAEYERQRNEKIQGEGLDYEQTQRFQPYAAAAQRMEALGQELAQRGEFSYAAAEDPLYAQYREQAQREGSRALEDAVGKAAAQTGGYGSSYALTAGQQGYERYLQALDDRIPELYQAAYDRWLGEDEQLREELAQAAKLENSEYGRLMEALERQREERRYAQEQETDRQRYEQGRQDAAQKTEQQRQDAAAKAEREAQEAQRKQAQADAAAASNRAYQLVMTMLTGGEMPGAALLQSAGISREDAQKLLRALARTAK